MLFKSRTVRQVAALPFVETDSGIEILLVTSRGTGRWIVPKGWPAGSLSMAEAAAREAEEEAGVLGEIQAEPIGTYRYAKAMDEGYEVDCDVFVYPLAVTQHKTDWPERGERRVRWAVLAEAPRLIGEPGLADLLGALAESGGAALRGRTSS